MSSSRPSRMSSMWGCRVCGLYTSLGQMRGKTAYAARWPARRSARLPEPKYPDGVHFPSLDTANGNQIALASRVGVAGGGGRCIAATDQDWLPAQQPRGV